VTDKASLLGLFEEEEEEKKNRLAERNC